MTPENKYVETPQEHHAKRPHFDGTITLGHILTAVMMGGAMLTMFVNFKLESADHETRIHFLEAATKEFKETTGQLVANQTTAIRNLDHITMLIDQLNSRKGMP